MKRQDLWPIDELSRRVVRALEGRVDKRVSGRLRERTIRFYTNSNPANGPIVLAPGATVHEAGTALMQAIHREFTYDGKATEADTAPDHAFAHTLQGFSTERGKKGQFYSLPELAKTYPNARITGVSNSASQREFIMARAAERGLTNLEIITCDMNDFEAPGEFAIFAARSFAFFFWAASNERIRARPSFGSSCRIDVPLYLPLVAITGSDPTKVGVITTWSPSTK